MSTYNIALFFHLLGVLLFVARIASPGFVEFARRQQRPAEIQLLLTMARAGVLLVGIGTVLLGGFGLWLVHLGDFGYSTGWIDVSIALYLIALILGALGGQRPRQARRLAAQLSKDQVATIEQVHALLDDPLSRAANYGSLTAILAILALWCRASNEPRISVQWPGPKATERGTAKPGPCSDRANGDSRNGRFARSGVGVDEGGCSPTRAGARCACRLSRIRPAASTATPAIAAKEGSPAWPDSGPTITVRECELSVRSGAYTAEMGREAAVA